MLAEDRTLAQRAATLEALLGDIECLPDPALRATATEIVQGLLALYGAGLSRMLALIKQHGDGTASAALLDSFAADDLISHLLLLHDLHPLDVQTRVARALDTVRPYLQSHGGDVELLNVAGGVARLRLHGSCSGCPSSTVTLKLAVEEAVLKAAPDLDGIEAEGVPPAALPSAAAGFVPVAAVRRRKDG